MFISIDLPCVSFYCRKNDVLLFSNKNHLNSTVPRKSIGHIIKITKIPEILSLLGCKIHESNRLRLVNKTTNNANWCTTISCNHHFTPRIQQIRWWPSPQMYWAFVLVQLPWMHSEPIHQTCTVSHVDLFPYTFPNVQSLQPPLDAPLFRWINARHAHHFKHRRFSILMRKKKSKCITSWLDLELSAEHLWSGFYFKREPF